MKNENSFSTTIKPDKDLRDFDELLFDWNSKLTVTVIKKSQYTQGPIEFIDPVLILSNPIKISSIEK